MNAVCVAMAVVLPALAAGGQEAGEDLVAVEVAQVLGTDPMPWVVELDSAQGDGLFAFRVTEAEAIAITLEARGEQTERPMSPAFVSLAAEAAGLGLTAVVLQRPQGPMGTFGWLWVEGPKGAYPVEVRGGDGVAIALHAPIPRRRRRGWTTASRCASTAPVRRPTTSPALSRSRRPMVGSSASSSAWTWPTRSGWAWRGLSCPALASTMQSPSC